MEVRDKHGRPLKVGDKVVIVAEIVATYSGDDYADLTLDTEYGWGEVEDFPAEKAQLVSPPQEVVGEPTRELAGIPSKTLEADFLGELQAASSAIADALGEDDDDLPDTTPAIVKIGSRTTLFSLTLGDFRRLRDTLARLENKS